MLEGATLLLCIGACQSIGQTYRTLHTFTGADGKNPEAGLFLSGATLYGTTVLGGAFYDGDNSGGVVFKVSTNGSGFTVLRRLTRSDGINPQAVPVVSGATLYGTARSGGDFDAGTLFTLGTNGSNFAVLHHFTFSDGANPQGSLLAGATLYGVAQNGGASGLGTVFKMNTDGSGFTVLKSFNGPGGSPRAAPILSDGALYGTTQQGAHKSTVFRINTDGTGFVTLHDFVGSDGAFVSGGPVLFGNALYGVTEYDSGSPGTYFGAGKIYKVNTDGTGFTVIKTFDHVDGACPVGSLALSGRTLYGATASNGGTVFRIHFDGSGHTVLKQFSNPEGDMPCGSPVLARGVLYGMTWQGGISNAGTLFALSLPPPEILTPPRSQTAEVGTAAAFEVRAEGSDPLSYQWLFNGTSLLSGQTNSVLRLDSLQPSFSGAYAAVVSDFGGSATSAPAMFSVIPLVPRRSVPGLILMGQAGIWLNLDLSGSISPPVGWATFAQVNLLSGSQWYFDLAARLPLERFYRAWHTNTASAPASLHLDMVPAIALNGNVGGNVRVDYINRIGPTNAWVTLATVPLTNSTQLYFDTSAPGQPPRLYRLLAVP